MKIRILACVLCASVVCLFAGCAWFGSGGIKLDPAGPSQGDVVRYDFKLAITTQHTLLQTFLDWEAANAPLLVNQPKVHALAQKIRTEGPGWFTEADKRLQEYESIAAAAKPDVPTLERARRALIAALGVIQAEQAGANAAMLANAAPPKN